MPDIEIMGFQPKKAADVEVELRELIEIKGSEDLKKDVVYTTHLGGIRVTTHESRNQRPYIRVWGCPDEPWFMEVFNLLKDLPYDLERAPLARSDDNGFHEGTYEEPLNLLSDSE